MRRFTTSRLGRLESESAAPFNAALLHAHREVVRHRYALLAASIAVYAAILLSLGTPLEVSGNYFVILPLLVAALGFGAPGGAIAGALGLPANLLIFWIIGHPEYSPASKPIAELSGLTLGLAMGMLAGYFRDIGREIRRREEVEESLREALDEKELLLRELHHRVKNNLNVMMSLVQLQKSRSSDPAFIDAAKELVGRIYAMAVVHDQLYGGAEAGSIDLGPYVEALARNLTASLGLDPARVSRRIGAAGRRLPADTAMSLGLIVNEIMTNAAKYGGTAAGSPPSIAVSLDAIGPEYRLAIEDDGPGPAPGSDPGLGTKIVAALAAHMGGAPTVSAIEGPGGATGTRFELRWRDAEDARG